MEEMADRRRFRRSVLRTGSAGVISSLAGCVRPATYSSRELEPPQIDLETDGSWPMAGYGPARTNYNPTAGGDRTGETELLWEHRFDANSPPEVAVVDGICYLTDGESTLYAFDLREGELEWSITDAIRGGPAVVDDRVVFTSENGVSAVDSRDGTERWSASLESPRNPVVDDGACYVRTDAGVAGIDAADGTILWERDPNVERAGAPAVHDGACYLLTSEGELLARDADDDDLLWRADVPQEDYPGVPSVTDEAVVVASGSDVVAFDPADGSSLWKREHGNAGRLAVTNDVVYTGREFLRGLDVETGEEVWEGEVDLVPPGSNVEYGFTAPVVGEDLVFVGSMRENCCVNGFDRDDGSLVLEHEITGDTSVTAVVGNALFVTKRNGWIGILGPERLAG